MNNATRWGDIRKQQRTDERTRLLDEFYTPTTPTQRKLEIVERLSQIEQEGVKDE
jgi:hypothetical protein